VHSNSCAWRHYSESASATRGDVAAPETLDRSRHGPSMLAIRAASRPRWPVKNGSRPDLREWWFSCRFGCGIAVSFRMDADQTAVRARPYISLVVEGPTRDRGLLLRS
jgi:hypothetical protein